MTVPMPLSELPREGSRFAGRRLSDLFGISDLTGCFEDEAWDLKGHPHMAGGGGKRTINFRGYPPPLIDSFKELILIAVRPVIHACDCPPLIGVSQKNLQTVIRWLSGLSTDLSYLLEKAGSLQAVTSSDYKTLKQAVKLTHRRAGALQSFARYSAAMSPGVEHLRCYPWPGRSGIEVAGGGGTKRAGNTTPLFPLESLGPFMECAMFLIEHGRDIVDVATEELVTDPAQLRSKGRVRNERTRERPPSRILAVEDPDGRRVELLRSGCGPKEAKQMLKQVSAACAFVTVALTGMRASEFEAVPRYAPLETIAVGGTARWLLHSYLCKGLHTPIQEKWLIPPLVAEAVELLQYLLDKRHLPPDCVFSPTGQAPLFDRRALSEFVKEGASTVMRLERVIATVETAMRDLSLKGLVEPPPGSRPNGRQLRRNFALVVASRPNGPQAAMEQFKWQHPDTASGYFRVAPEGVAVGQRAVYEEVVELQKELALDALADEFGRWQAQINTGSRPTPVGPDGRRKRDMFAGIQKELIRESLVEEDPRRLRLLLRNAAESLHLTELGWCDWDENQARCGGIGGPKAARCEPYTCLNHSIPFTALPAHRVKRERFLQLARDRTLPLLARERAEAEVKSIEKHLGPDLV